MGFIGNSEDHTDVDHRYQLAFEEDTTISIATVYRKIKLLRETGVFYPLGFGDDYARFEESGQHHENSIVGEMGKVTEFCGAELTVLKEKIVNETGQTPVDHRLRLFDRKIT